MAVLVFLARTAGAHFVAPDTAPGGGVVRITFLTRNESNRRDLSNMRHLVFARNRIEVVRGHFRQFRLLRLLLHQFHAHQLGGNGFAQIGQQRLEQLEGFRLVFLQRVALGITAETDDGTQMIEVDDMFAPQMVDRLQDDRAFDIGHDLGAETLRPLGGVFIGGLGDTLQNIVFGDAFFLCPFLHRQVEVQELLDTGFQARNIPLFGIGIFPEYAW